MYSEIVIVLKENYLITSNVSRKWIAKMMLLACKTDYRYNLIRLVRKLKLQLVYWIEFIGLNSEFEHKRSSAWIIIDADEILFSSSVLNYAGSLNVTAGHNHKINRSITAITFSDADFARNSLDS